MFKSFSPLAMPVLLLIFLPLWILAQDKPVLLNDVSVRLRPDDPFPHVAPQSQGAVFYEVTNSADRDLKLLFKLKITPVKGSAFSLEQDLDLTSGQTIRVPMPDEVAHHRGVVRFDWELTDQEGRRLALSDTLGVMTLPGPEQSHRHRFRFGWGTALVHFVDAKEDAQNMAAYAQMGCDVIRIGDRWAYSSEREGNQNYFAQAGEIADAATKEKIDLLYVMWGTPPNLVRETFSHKDKVAPMAIDTKTKLEDMVRVSPPHKDAWLKRVKETVSKFKDRVRYWEIWNDQDRYHDHGQHMPNGWVGNTDEYLDLLRSSHDEIKKADPELQVLTGGFFTPGADNRRDLNPDMQQRVVTEAQDSFDILAFMDANPSNLLGPLQQLRRELKTPKPLWLTRVEQRGATPDELVRRLVSAKASGANAFIWMWALNFDSGHRGFLMPMNTWKTKDRQKINQHTSFQIQPAGCAYVHAIGLLRMLEPLDRIETGTTGEWVFPFASADQKSGEKVIAFWHEKDLPDTEREVELEQGVKAVWIDIYGNETPVTPAGNGKVTLPIRHSPQFLRTQL